MKAVLGSLFYLALMGLFRPSDSKNLATNKEQRPTLLTCFTMEQRSVERECLDMANEMSQKFYVPSMSDCIDMTEVVKGSSIKETCETQYFRQVYITYSDCVFSKIGAMSIATDPIDVKSFIDATITASNLEGSKKNAATKDFNACMAANYSLPYSHFSYNSDKNPPILRSYIEKMNQQLDFGQLAPTASILAMDCVTSALVHNGCVASSDQTVAELTQELHPSSYPADSDLWMSCLNEDRQWFNFVCGASAWSELAPRWSQDCTKATQPSRGDENSCRVKRMKQYLNFVTDCLMQKSKAVSAFYSMKLFNKKDPMMYKDIVIGGSTLSDQQKKSSMKFFDQCMAENATLPYKTFPYDVEKVPGPAVNKDFLNLINVMFRIGNQLATMPMRADDCLISALLLNGCNAKQSSEVAMRIFTGLSGMDKLFDLLNYF